MAELQLVDYGRVKPLSLTDAIAEWQQIDANKQQQKLNEMKMAEAEFNAPLERRMNEARAQDYTAQAELNQQKAHMQRVQFANNIARQAFAYADKTGLKQGTPEYDQAVRQAAEPFRGAMSQAFGHADTGEPIDVNALRSLASMDVTGGAEYHPPVATSQGYLQWKDGQFSPLSNEQGQAYMPVPADIGLAYNKKGAETAAGMVKVQFPDGSEGYVPAHQANAFYDQFRPKQSASQLPSNVTMDLTNPEDIAAAKQDFAQYGASYRPGSEIIKSPSLAAKEQVKTEAAINEAVGKEQGKSEFEAQRDLPAVIDQANNALRLISELKTHPGKAGMVGMPNLSGALGGVKGSKEASFNTRLNQIKGQNFLQAFQNLKGAGQITEIEGQKATEAIARLDTAQEEKEFDQALDELSDIVKQGLNRAKTKAGAKEPAIKSDLDIHSEADAILRGSK